MTTPNPYLRANSIIELLSWDDVDFVRCAYVSILGRQPDPEGERFYTAEIRRGRSKMSVLRVLRASAEGRFHDPGMRGLDRAIRRARLEESRLGWMLRSFTKGEGSGSVWRRHRMLMNELSRARMQSAARGSDWPVLLSEMRGLRESIRALESRGGTGEAMHQRVIQDPEFRNLSAKAKVTFKRLHAYSN